MRDKLKPLSADAVIVLANQMDANGILNFESIARANMAVKLLNTGNIPHIVTCGWAYRRETKINIADAFKEYLIDRLSVDSNKILTEINSRDTVGDAIFTKINLANNLSWRKILVVTSNYHVRRTEEIFNFIYGNNFSVNVFGVDVDFSNSTLDNELASTEAFRKTFFGIEKGKDDEIFKRLYEKHPFYNGAIYNAIE